MWDRGVETFDASINQTFNMDATVMWTISDFLALVSLSRCNTHTSLVAPFLALSLSFNIYFIVRNHVSCVIIVSWIEIIDLGSIDLNLMVI